MVQTALGGSQDAAEVRMIMKDGAQSSLLSTVDRNRTVQACLHFGLAASAHVPTPPITSILSLVFVVPIARIYSPIYYNHVYIAA